MSLPFAPDLCVIGAGSGGLSVAAGAAQMGAEVVLIERGLMGGDCLNFGCVPSKSLLAAARLAQLPRRGAALGIASPPPRIEFAPVADSVQEVIRAIGARVTVLDVGPFLPRDDPELSASLIERLAAEGIAARPRVEIAGIECDGRAITASLASGERITGSHLLVAAGRRPTVEALDLAAAKIEATAQGITVDARLRTTNRRAFAVGDVAGGAPFTHIANYHAGILMPNAPVRLP